VEFGELLGAFLQCRHVPINLLQHRVNRGGLLGVFGFSQPPPLFNHQTREPEYASLSQVLP